MNTCRAKGCIFSNTHVTLGHRCGKCNLFGHGKVECGKSSAILLLRDLSRNDKIPEDFQCNVHDCLYKWFHIKSAHYCKTCSKRGHGASNCPQSRRSGNSSNNLGFFSRDYENNHIAYASLNTAFSKMGSIDGKIYVTIPYEMGCSFWYRRSSRYAFLERLFMHPDDWGQYGQDKVIEYTSFINGYIQI
jgi:hypothetical protein